jgi:hypothetical protein
VNKLTVTILRSLGQRPKPTYWSISQRLGVQPRPVREELGHLESTLVKKVRVLPDVTLFGLTRTAVNIQMSDKVRENVKSKLRLLDFVEAAYVTRPFVTPTGKLHSFHRPVDVFFTKVSVVHSGEKDFERHIQLMKAVLGEFEVMYASRVEGQKYERKIGESALDVLKELARQPMAEIGEIARAVSVSPKTAAKYLALLKECKAYYYEPILDSMKSDLVVFTLMAPLGPNSDKKQIMKALKANLHDYWILDNPGSTATAALVCVADTLGEALEAYERARMDPELAGAALLLGFEGYDNLAHVGYLKRTTRQRAPGRESRVRGAGPPSRGDL